MINGLFESHFFGSKRKKSRPYVASAPRGCGSAAFISLVPVLGAHLLERKLRTNYNRQVSIATNGPFRYLLKLDPHCQNRDLIATVIHCSVHNKTLQLVAEGLAQIRFSCYRLGARAGY